MDERNRSGDLRSAFLSETPEVLPGTIWREMRDGASLEYPEDSPVLGALRVEFGWDEITVFVGPRGHHTHFGVDESPSGDAEEQTRQAARAALAFVRDVIEDRISIRWGLLVSGAHSLRRGATVAGRIWKRVTPWIREAVWSGRA
jgi:hypothetical protein